MKREIFLVSVILFCFASGAFAETREAENKKWQISLEQYYDSLPKTKNLETDMRRAVNSSNNQDISLKYLFLEQNDPANIILRNIVSGIFMRFNYGQSALDLNFEMTDSSSTKFNVSNTSCFGYGSEVVFNARHPWRFSIASLIKYGNIPNASINYSSYQNGGTNFAKKVRGSWNSSDAIMELVL
ncbi:MAG: hypothetical protein FD145_1565 [Candidatus Saganbacteria bacterium]|uniref:Uncharacterized protein n=1 Tax=Candidatus Saganbacteria bacterium TaxID=2575572 RepID=A0A833KZJ9_UNCSA|nr:MAG: hypothetical protein FD145_1565 [Candidatus Saganbacteria bacterium]